MFLIYLNIFFNKKKDLDYNCKKYIVFFSKNVMQLSTEYHANF